MESVTENHEAEKGMDCKSYVCGSYRHCETSLWESDSKAKKTQLSLTWEPNDQNLDFGPWAQHGVDYHSLHIGITRQWHFHNLSSGEEKQPGLPL